MKHKYFPFKLGNLTAVCSVLAVIALAALAESCSNSDTARESPDAERASDIPRGQEPAKKVFGYEIHDRHGELLAGFNPKDAAVISIDTDVFVASPFRVHQLAEIIGVDADFIYRELAFEDEGSSVVLTRSAPLAAIAAIAERKDSEGVRLFFGVAAELGKQRHYPLGKDAFHAVGVVSDTSTKLVGRRGLEAWESRLREKDEARSTDALVSTLDSSLQKRVALALSETLKANGFSAAGAVLLDIESGAARAMVSLPTLDPNDRAASRARTYSPAWQNNAVETRFIAAVALAPILAAAALDTQLYPATMAPLASLKLPGAARALLNHPRLAPGLPFLFNRLMPDCNIVDFDTAFGANRTPNKPFEIDDAYTEARGSDLVNVKSNLLAVTNATRAIFNGRGIVTAATLVALEAEKPESVLVLQRQSVEPVWADLKAQTHPKLAALPGSFVDLGFNPSDADLPLEMLEDFESAGALKTVASGFSHVVLLAPVTVGGERMVLGVLLIKRGQHRLNGVDVAPNFVKFWLAVQSSLPK
jgi:hypothetical protein